MHHPRPRPDDRSRPLWGWLLCLSIAFPSGLLLAGSAFAQQGGAQAEGVEQILAQFPAGDPSEGERLLGSLLLGGEETCKRVIAKLAPPEQGGDAAVRYAVHGLAMKAGARSDGPERELMQRCLLEAIASREDSHIRSFLIRRLRFVAGEACIEPMGQLLDDEDLADSAVGVLSSLCDKPELRPRVKAVLRAALQEAGRDSVRIRLVRTLGQLRDREAVELIRPFLNSDNADLQQQGISALAALGDAESYDRVKELAETQSGYHRIETLASLLRLARRSLDSEILPDAEVDPRKYRQARDRRDASVEKLVATAKTLLDQNNLPNSLFCDAMRVVMKHREGPDHREWLMRYAQSDDDAIRLATLDLMAKMDSVDNAVMLRDLYEATQDARRAEVVAAWLRSGLRNQPGDGRGAIGEILREALQDPSKAVRLVAVEWLGGDGSGWDSPDKLDMLLGQMSGNDRDLIAAAADSLRRTPSEPFGRQIADAMDGASPAGQEALLELLAARSCDGQVGVVIRYACESKNPRVRLAAVRALADLAGPEELPELFAIYLEEDSSAVRQAARKALADRIAEDREAREAVVAMFLPEAGDRNHPLVRLAEEAGEPGKRRLLELLPHLGGEDSLRAVRAAVDSEAPDLRDTAVRALADWPDPEAAPQLIEIARESESKLHRTLALRAYIRLVAEPSATAAPETVEKLRAALELTEDPATQRLALSALGRLRDRDALRLVAEHLDGPNREEAAAAAVNILLPTDGRRGIRGRLACRVADRVLHVSKNETLLKRLRAYRPQLDSLNLAIDQPAEATCAHEGDRVASLAVDGLIRQDSAWFGEKWPCSLTVDLEESQTIDVVRPVFYWDGVRHYQYTIEVSTDGESWTQVVDASTTEEPAEMTGDVHEIEPVEARYVRLNVLKNSANPAVHVVELEVYAPGGHPDRYPGPRPVRAEPANPLPEPDENGFIPLFNGRDLRGWIGSTDGYEVRDGNLVCRPKVGRNLFFEHPFDDFELHFEFRLTPGANNGLAIRSPLHGNPAYVGMELQILDNAHPKYARLKPYQYHGSIYGVVPAERGALKPAGQWNRQVVRAVGPKITVEVNGRKIVDADLSEITETADGRGRKGHPGILRSDGHIGFLGHGDEVAFRNIRIRPIDRDQESQEKKP